MKTPGIPTPRAPAKGKNGKIRKRRPLSSKEKLARLDFHSMLPTEDAFHFKLQTGIEKAVAREYRKVGAARHMQTLLFQPSKDWYEKEREKSLGMRKGPLDVYTLTKWRMLKIAGERPGDFNWHQAARYRGVGADWLCYMFSLASMIPKPYERTRAKASLARDARVAGFQLGGKFSLPAATVEWKPCVKAILKEKVRELRGLFPHWAAYVYTNTFVTTLSSQSWKLSLVNAQRKVKEFNFDENHLTATEEELYDQGKDMHRVPYDTKLEKPGCAQELGDRQFVACQNWADSCGITLGNWSEEFNTDNATHLGDNVCSPYAARGLHAFQCCERLLEDETWLATVEDKDPSLIWLQHTKGYMYRWCNRLASQTRWRIANVSEKLVVDYYRQLVNNCLPRSLLGSSSSLFKHHIPYAYASIKHKCYSGNPTSNRVHSCEKPNHSCERNIISFKRLPGRKVFKKIGRCLRHLLELYGRGWNFSCLTNSASELSEKYAATTPRAPGPNCCCLKCGAAMKTPSIIAADAGQAYEELGAEFVSSTLEFFYEEAGFSKEGKKDVAISISNSTRHQSRSGGKVIDVVNDRVVFWVSRVRKCVDSLLAMKIFKLGNRFLAQVRGIPIGGPISGIVLDLCLARLECIYDKKSWPQLASTAGRKSQPRDKLIAAGRYADDCILVSRWFCPSCLFQTVTKTYGSQVKFEWADTGTDIGNASMMNVLDFWAHVNWSTIVFSIDSANEASVWFKSAGLAKKKTRYPVYAGQTKKIQGNLLRDILGRVARLRQLKISAFACYYAWLVDIAELAQNGFPLSVVIGTLQKIPFKDFVYEAGLKAASALKRLSEQNGKVNIQNQNPENQDHQIKSQSHTRPPQYDTQGSVRFPFGGKPCSVVRGVVPCSALSGHAVPCSAVPGCVVPCSAVSPSLSPCRAVPCSAVSCSSRRAVPWETDPCHVMPNSVVQCLSVRSVSAENQFQNREEKAFKHECPVAILAQNFEAQTGRQVIQISEHLPSTAAMGKNSGNGKGTSGAQAGETSKDMATIKTDMARGKTKETITKEAVENGKTIGEAKGKWIP